ncbi:MAG: dihydrolipoamide acetyltransferase family protein [Mycobacterium sp.]
MNEFLVPDLGEGLEEATITEWNVAVGDVVVLNQTLCTLETAKAAVEIPSPYAGKVVTLGGRAGDVLAVGSVLVGIETDSRTPVLVGYGADDGLDKSRRSRPKAKPAVRKLAADLLVDLNDVEPGPDGVVTRDAVLAKSGITTEARGHEVLPVRGVHAEMAKRMALSRSVIPDAHAAVDIDGTRLLESRERLGVSTFVLTLRLLVHTLGRHRILNSTWADGPNGSEVHLHHGINLGFGVAAPRGLLVPVVAQAHTLTTRDLAAEVNRLVEAARAGTLKPAELQGATFTVSNFGALGLDDGVPVINPPESAILGMGMLKPRAMVVDGAVVARPTMRLICAFDHRVADGAQVAAFLGELRALLESPDTALLDL